MICTETLVLTCFCPIFQFIFKISFSQAKKVVNFSFKNFEKSDPKRYQKKTGELFERRIILVVEVSFFLEGGQGYFRDLSQPNFKMEVRHPSISHISNHLKSKYTR